MKFPTFVVALSVLAKSRVAGELRRAKASKGEDATCLQHENTYMAPCETWCTEYLSVCKDPTIFAPQDGYNKCVEECTQLPRTKTDVTRPPSTFVHLGGDTFACRDLHLWEAMNAPDGYPYNTVFHCDHPSVCADVEIDGKTPFRHLRDGQCTQQFLGYCFVSGDGTIADCSKGQVTDASIADVLKMMPETIEYLFMMENEGITTLPEGLFSNLPAPKNLKALYLDDCNIESMHEEVFHPLENLEVLNLPFNKITILQDELLKLPKLRQFTIYGDPTSSDPDLPFGPGGGRKPGMLTSGSFTNKLFQYTPNLERLIMYGHAGIDKLHAGMFNGLSKVHTMFFVFCGLTNLGIPDDVFYPLVSMKYFDFQGNMFTKLPKEWFGQQGGWSKNLERIAFFINEISEVDKEVFTWHPKLKSILLHANPLTVIDASYYANNDLKVLTI